METVTTKDAFDRWWEWANKPLDSPLMIPSELHDAVMTLKEEERTDRATVNEAVRTSGSPWHPAGGDARYGVPIATK